MFSLCRICICAALIHFRQLSRPTRLKKIAAYVLTFTNYWLIFHEHRNTTRRTMHILHNSIYLLSLVNPTRVLSRSRGVTYHVIVYYIIKPPCMQVSELFLVVVDKIAVTDLAPPLFRFSRIFIVCLPVDILSGLESHVLYLLIQNTPAVKALHLYR